MEQNDQSPFPENPSRSSDNVGPLAAAVVIVVLLAVAGFYFLSLEREPAAEPQDTAPQSSQEEGESVEDIEAELNALQTTSTEADVDDLDSAL